MSSFNFCLYLFAPVTKPWTLAWSLKLPSLYCCATLLVCLLVCGCTHYCKYTLSHRAPVDRVSYNQNQMMTIEQSQHWFILQRSNVKLVFQFTWSCSWCGWCLSSSTFVKRSLIQLTQTVMSTFCSRVKSCAELNQVVDRLVWLPGSV